MHARHAFVYDTHTVIVGTESGTAFTTDPVEVGAYDRRSAELEDVAVFGDQAVHVFERVAEAYRSLCPAGNGQLTQHPIAISSV